LFDYVMRSNKAELVGLCRQAYGNPIEAVPQRSVSGSKDPSFRTYLSGMKSQIGSDIRRELCSRPQMQKIIEDFYLTSSLTNYFPALDDDNSGDGEDKWTTSNELDTLQNSLKRVLEDNKALIKKIAETEQVSN